MKQWICLMLVTGVLYSSVFSHDQNVSDFTAPSKETTVDDSFVDNTVVFERLSPDRIETLRQVYSRRLFKIQSTVFAMLIGAGVLGGIGIAKSWNATSQAAISSVTVDGVDTDKMKLALRVQEQRFLQMLKQPIAWAIGVGVGGGVVAGLAPLVKIIYETSGEAVRLSWHGYDYWFGQLNERLAADISRLCASLGVRLQDAEANISFQTNDDEQFPLARAAQIIQQNNRVRDLQEHRRSDIEKYYRATVITEYQCVLGTLERLIALMFEIAPQDKHTLLAQGVDKLSCRINRLVHSLERDLNADTRMIATYYSATTRQYAHELYEEIKIFVNRFNVYWRI